MSLLKSLELLLAKNSSFAKCFLALSFALTAVSIAACSKNNGDSVTKTGRGGDVEFVLEFAYDVTLKDALTEANVDLTATLDVDGEGDIDPVKFDAGVFTVRKESVEKGTTIITFTLRRSGFVKVTKALNEVKDDAKAAVVLTLTKNNKTAMLGGTQLFTFLKGLDARTLNGTDATTISNFAGDTHATDAELTSLLEELKKLIVTALKA